MATEHYSYRVFWSPDDGEFVGICSELPSLSHLARTRAEALTGIQRLTEFVVKDLRKAGEPIPPALADQKFSGNLRVRLPTNLHRSLVFEAAELNRSLNRVIIDKLLASPSSPLSRKRTTARSTMAPKMTRKRASKVA